MNRFSISELQNFSGIKAHTIRMWEQRYQALKPDRSEGNTRYYDGSQLRRLLNIVSLLDSNYKVSELCSMTDEQLVGLLEKHLLTATVTQNSYEYYISQIIAAAIEYDEAKFDKLFSNTILRIGLKKTYIKIIYPMLVRIGLMWLKDALPPAQEHFITNLIRQKILAATDALPPASSNRNMWMLFLPEDEFHEIGLLFSNFLIRHAGKKVIYLGANVPFNSLKLAVDDIKPANLLFFLVRKDDVEKNNEWVKLMHKNFSTQRIFVAAESSRLKELKNKKNIVCLHSVEDLERELV